MCKKTKAEKLMDYIERKHQPILTANQCLHHILSMTDAEFEEAFKD